MNLITTEYSEETERFTLRRGDLKWTLRIEEATRLADDILDVIEALDDTVDE